MANMVQSLFGLTPEQVGLQEEAQRQQTALDIARLDPFQAAKYSIGLGASQLGTGIARAMGYESPAMKQAKERQGLLSGMSIQDPAALKDAAQKAWNAGQFDVAQNLLNQAQELEATEAKTLAAQAQAKKALREENPVFKLVESGKYTPKSISSYAKSGNLEDLQLKESDAKTQVIDTPAGQQLINSQNGEVIATFAGKPIKPSIGSEVAAGLAPLVGAIAAGQAKAAGGKSGEEVGKAVAQINSGYAAESALRDALQMVDTGIYAGGYGPMQELASKYTGGVIGDKKRLVNTEQFRAYIGNVVIPMMSQLGGSDSNEELKYMKSIAGGETTLEPEAMKKILQRAQRAVNNDILRKQQQYTAVQQGQPLPVGPVGTQKAGTQRKTKSGVAYTVED